MRPNQLKSRLWDSLAKPWYYTMVTGNLQGHNISREYLDLEIHRKGNSKKKTTQQ